MSQRFLLHNRRLHDITHQAVGQKYTEQSALLLLLTHGADTTKRLRDHVCAPQVSGCIDRQHSVHSGDWSAQRRRTQHAQTRVQTHPHARLLYTTHTGRSQTTLMPTEQFSSAECGPAFRQALREESLREMVVLLCVHHVLLRESRLVCCRKSRAASITRTSCVRWTSCAM